MSKPFDFVGQNSYCKYFKVAPIPYCELNPKTFPEEQKKWSYEYDEACDIRDELVCYLVKKEIK